MCFAIMYLGGNIEIYFSSETRILTILMVFYCICRTQIVLPTVPILSGHFLFLAYCLASLLKCHQNADYPYFWVLWVQKKSFYIILMILYADKYNFYQSLYLINWPTYLVVNLNKIEHKDFKNEVKFHKFYLYVLNFSRLQ